MPYLTYRYTEVVKLINLTKRYDNKDLAVLAEYVARHVVPEHQDLIVIFTHDENAKSAYGRSRRFAKDILAQVAPGCKYTVEVNLGRWVTYPKMTFVPPGYFYPSFELRSYIEEIIFILGHEMRHIAQYKAGVTGLNKDGTDNQDVIDAMEYDADSCGHAEVLRFREESAALAA